MQKDSVELASSVAYRELSTFAEFQECVGIQRETWGDEFEELVPTAILKVSQKVGGIVAGAYDASGRMLGFVYGMAGLKNGKPIHWSHMLAVRKETRGLGLGKLLKLYQRELLLARGVDTVFWTYDPLVARNANLNLNGLGAVVEEYVKDMYLESSSSLHRGMSMDRFVVSWNIRSERVSEALAGRRSFDATRFRDTPIVNTSADTGQSDAPGKLNFPQMANVRVEIPPNLEELNSRSMEEAKVWRQNTRDVFLWYLNRGYSVDGFSIDQETRRCFYFLSSSAEDRQ
jgi:predicted GNAT superfamily acetyltransferase